MNTSPSNPHLADVKITQRELSYNNKESSKDTAIPAEKIISFNGSPSTSPAAVDMDKEFPIEDDFPIEVFPADIQEQCKRIAAYNRVQFLVPAIGFLGGASIAIGRGFDYAITDTGRVTPCALWLNLVAPPSVGKSSMMEPLNIFLDMYAKEDTEWLQIKRTSLEKQLNTLIAKEDVAKKAKDWPEVEKLKGEIQDLNAELKNGRPMWLGQDFTPEAITSAMSGSTSRPAFLAVVSSEGRAIVENLFGRYGESNEAFWLPGFGRNDPVIRQRKDHHISSSDGVATGFQLCATFAIQPDHHEKLMTGSFASSGFNQRRLFAIAKSGEYISPHKAARLAAGSKLPPADLTEWNNWVKTMFRCVALKKEGERIKSSDEAIAVLDKLYTHYNQILQSGKAGAMASTILRFGEQAIRIATVLHCMTYGLESASCKKTISESTMRDACRVVRWFGRQMSNNAWESNYQASEKLKETILRFAKSQGDRGFAIHELTKASVGERVQLEQIVNSLDLEGVIRNFTPPRGAKGRSPATRWKLNS